MDHILPVEDSELSDLPMQEYQLSRPQKAFANALSIAIIICALVGLFGAVFFYGMWA